MGVISSHLVLGCSALLVWLFLSIYLNLLFYQILSKLARKLSIRGERVFLCTNIEPTHRQVPHNLLDKRRDVWVISGGGGGG